jgi:hypothetical protein
LWQELLRWFLWKLSDDVLSWNQVLSIALYILAASDRMNLKVMKQE